MNWQTSADGGGEIEFGKGCTASIRFSPNRAAVHWRFKLDGRSGSVLSAQSRLESIARELGVEVESPKVEQDEFS